VLQNTQLPRSGEDFRAVYFPGSFAKNIFEGYVVYCKKLSAVKSGENLGQCTVLDYSLFKFLGQCTV